MLGPELIEPLARIGHHFEQGPGHLNLQKAKETNAVDDLRFLFWLGCPTAELLSRISLHPPGVVSTSIRVNMPLLGVGPETIPSLILPPPGFIWVVCSGWIGAEIDSVVREAIWVRNINGACVLLAHSNRRAKTVERSSS